MIMDTNDKSTEAPRSGIVRDVRQLRFHGGATAAELQDFIAKTRGRNPREVLGMLAGSDLARSIVLACGGAVLVLAVSTVVPWLLSRENPDVPSPTKPAAAASPTVDETAVPEREPAAAAPTQVADDPKPSPADAEKAVSAMGLGDTKAAAPDTNPLEKDLDNLLDNLK